MAKHAKTDSGQKYLPDETPDRYPALIRAYGVLSIIAGCVQLVLVAIIIFALIAALASGTQFDLSSIEPFNITSLVIQLVSFFVSVVLAGMFVVLGMRLLRGNRKSAALLINIMLALEATTGICEFMLVGIDERLIPIIVNSIILIALQTYSDPSLREERQLQRKLRALEDKAQAEDGTLGRDTTGKGYITLNFYNIFWVFVVCCVLGLLIETAYHMIIVDPGHFQNRAGLLYGPFSPIYGFGAVLMTTVLNRFHNRSFIIIFLVSAIIGGAFEFFVSWFMETAFGITAWDYTGQFLSIGGRTCGLFMAMWGVLGLVWVKFLLPRMLDLINRIPWNWRYTVTTIAATLMFINCGLTLAALDCWYERMAGTMDYENASAITQFCNEHYNNEFMENRFQSMNMDPDSASRID